MHRIRDVIKKLIVQGIEVIVVTDVPGQFISVDNLSVVKDWNDSWGVVDLKVGENRRMYRFDMTEEDLVGEVILEMYTPAAILEDAMFVFKNQADVIFNQYVFRKIKHLVVLLGGNDFFTSIDALNIKFPELNQQSFIVGPLSPKQDSLGITYYRPKAMTIIIEWPRMIDRDNLIL
jgi:hypothetical protein